MGRRGRALVAAAALAGILSLLSWSPEPPRPAVLGERTDASAPAFSPAGGPEREGRAAAAARRTTHRR